MNGYYNYNNDSYKKNYDEEEKLRKALERYYLMYVSNKDERIIQNPYFELIEFIEQDNLIDNIFESYKNNLFHKILHKNREKGLIVYILSKDFDDKYKNLKRINTDFDRIYLPEYYILSDRIKSEYLLDVINILLNKYINGAKDNFSKMIAFGDNKIKFIPKTINDVLDSYVRVKEKIKSKEIEKYDEKYFLLIQEKLYQILKDLIVSYYDLLPSKTVNKIKKEFYNLHLLFTTSDLKSFKVVVRIQNQLNTIRRELIDKGLIESISINDFNRIFTDNIIVNKINWIGEAGQLYHFINRLVKINNSFVKKKEKTIKYKYILTSKCFYIKGEEIYAEKFKHQKKPKNNLKVEMIDKIFVLTGFDNINV